MLEIATYGDLDRTERDLCFVRTARPLQYRKSYIGQSLRHVWALAPQGRFWADRSPALELRKWAQHTPEPANLPVVL